MTNNLSKEYQARLDKWRADMQSPTGKKTSSTRQWDYGEDLKTFQDKEQAMWQRECENNPK